MFCVFYVYDGNSRMLNQPKVVLWRSPGIKPATPGLQGIVFVPRLVTAVDG